MLNHKDQGLAQAIFTALILLLWIPQSLAQVAVHLFDEQQVIKLNKHTKILIEDRGRQDISDIIYRKDDFKRPDSGNPNYGFNNQAMWFHNEFSNYSALQYWTVSVGYPQNDHVDIYVVYRGDLIAQTHHGKLSSYHAFRYPELQVSLPFAQPVDLFVRVQGNSAHRLVPITVEASSHYSLGKILDTMLFGLFYGALLALMIYSLILFKETRDPSLLAYCGFTGVVIALQVVWSGHLQLLSIGGIALWLNTHLSTGFLLLQASAGVFSLIFLTGHVSRPSSITLIRITLLATFILLLLSPIKPWSELWHLNIAHCFNLLAFCVYLYAGLDAYFNHFCAARYFVFAWSLLLVSALVGMLTLTGVFPTNVYTMYMPNFGILLHILLCAVALVEKNPVGVKHLEDDELTHDLMSNIEYIEEQNVRLDLARKEALKASQIKSQFLANMSHEIRTPLNAILGFSKELASLQLPPDKKEHVSIINSSASSLLAIVNDVLDFSKIEAGKLHINNAPFNLNSLLEELVFVNTRAAHRKQLEFIYQHNPIPEKLLGDASRIRQILNNLLSNALKFTESGHVRLQVAGRETLDGNWEVQFLVQDTGIGINEQDRDKLFKAFSQLDGAVTRAYQGTGLGLVITQQLVQLMKGSIQVDSEPEQGSTFKVVLQFHKLSNKFDLSYHPEWQNKKVLWLDASPMSAQANAQTLRLLGAQVEEYQDIALLPEEGQYHYLFVNVQPGSAAEYESQQQRFVNCTAHHKVVLFNESDYHFKYSGLCELFEQQLETPLTLSQLLNFSETAQDTEQDTWKQRLQALPPVKILAVDDLEINLRLLRTWLSPTPVDLVLSYSGAEAVERCERDEFDLILMDIQMPNMDGLQATQAIRKTDLNQGTPIIAVTAHAFREEQQHLLSSGMDDYLPKPVELEALLDMIERWCEQVEVLAPELADIDFELACKRANQNRPAAADLLKAFVEQLPGNLDDMLTAFGNDDMKELQHLVHKLHGACCYTGVPKLESLCNSIEALLKTDQVGLVRTQMPELFAAGEQILAQAKEFK